MSSENDLGDAPKDKEQPDAAPDDDIAEDEPQADVELHHPFFDHSDPPSALDCQDALNRIACVLELLSFVDLDSNTLGELTPEAVAGHRYLTNTMRETLAYTSQQLGKLGRKQRQTIRKKARYLSALLDSLSILGDDDRDSVLDEMAEKLKVARSKVDSFVNNAKAK